MHTRSIESRSALPASQPSGDRQPRPHHTGGSHGTSPSSSDSARHSSSTVDLRPLPELALGSAAASSREAAWADLVAEGLITLAQAARLCPRRRQGKNVHTSTLYRWATRGTRGVRLEVIDTPGGLCTSKQAIGRFFARLTAARNLPGQRSQPPRDKKHHEAVEEELKQRFGI